MRFLNTHVVATHTQHALEHYTHTTHSPQEFVAPICELAPDTALRDVVSELIDSSTHECILAGAHDMHWMWCGLASFSCLFAAFVYTHSSPLHQVLSRSLQFVRGHISFFWRLSCNTCILPPAHNG